MLVGQRSTEEDICFRLLAGGVSALQDLTLTVADVAHTMPVAKAVVEQLNLPEQSAEEVLRNMSAEPEPATMFVNISYEDSDPQRAQLIANTIGQVVSEKASEVSVGRSEEHTSELQSRQYLVCRLLLEKKKRQHASRARK